MTDAESEPEFSIACSWCTRDVVSFVRPPAMIEVIVDPGVRHTVSAWRICLDCYAELVKLVAARAISQ